LKQLENFGGICDCQSTRDTFLYAASVDSRGLEATVEILGDVVLRPQITDDELELTRLAISYELEDANMRPDQDPLLVEAIHAAAFSGNTLGLAKLCPEANLEAIGRQTILSYMRSYHTPDRMVLAGVGIDHDRLVEAAQVHNHLYINLTFGLCTVCAFSISSQTSGPTTPKFLQADSKLDAEHR
jgi:processing peptidase subunit alpha